MRTRTAVGLIILVGLATHLGALRWGFLFDDYLHQYVLRDAAGATHLSKWNLYDFTASGPREENLAAWHMGLWWTAPDFATRFLRPVTSLSLWLDYCIFGHHAVGYHVTSLGIFAVLLGLVWRLFRQLGMSTSAALWGLAFVAFDDVHTLPVGWLANRNALLAALFTVATILAVIRYQRGGHRRYLVGAGVGLLLACGSKESGLAALPLVALVIGILDTPQTAPPLHGWVGRVVRSPAFLLCCAAAAAFLAVYVVGGYGAHSAVYPVPWVDQGAYVRRLLAWLPLASLSLFLGSFLDAIAPRPQWIGPLAGLAAVLLVGGAILAARALKPNRLTVFGVGWILACLLVEAGSDFSDRLLATATVGAGLLFGQFFEQLGDWRGRLRSRQYAVVGLAGLLLLAGIIAPLPLSVVRGEVFAALGIRDRDDIRAAAVQRDAPAPRQAILLNSPSSMLGLTFSATWAVEQGDRGTWVFPLQLGGRAISLTREDERTLLLTSEAEPFGANRIERIFRWHRPPQPGDEFRCGAFTATTVADEGMGVRTVRLIFERPLEDSSYLFMIYGAGGLVPWSLPEVGATVHVAAVPPRAWYVP